MQTVGQSASPEPPVARVEHCGVGVPVHSGLGPSPHCVAEPTIAAARKQSMRLKSLAVKCSDLEPQFSCYKMGILLLLLLVWGLS